MKGPTSPSSPRWPPSQRPLHSAFCTSQPTRPASLAAVSSGHGRAPHLCRSGPDSPVGRRGRAPLRLPEQHAKQGRDVSTQQIKCPVPPPPTQTHARLQPKPIASAQISLHYSFWRRPASAQVSGRAVPPHAARGEGGQGRRPRVGATGQGVHGGTCAGRPLGEVRCGHRPHPALAPPPHPALPRTPTPPSPSQPACTWAPPARSRPASSGGPPAVEGVARRGGGGEIRVRVVGGGRGRVEPAAGGSDSRAGWRCSHGQARLRTRLQS